MPIKLSRTSYLSPSGVLVERPPALRQRSRLEALRAIAAVTHVARVERRGLRGLLGWYRIELLDPLGGTVGGPGAVPWHLRFERASDFLLDLNVAYDAGWEDRLTDCASLDKRRRRLQRGHAKPGGVRP